MTDIPPKDHAHEAATWLGERHHSLAFLADRIGCLYAWPSHTGPVFDLDGIAETIREDDQHTRDFEAYAEKSPSPSNEDEWETWRDNGPKATPSAARFGKLSATEQARLRLLATLSRFRVEFRLSDLAGMDANGEQLIRDWVAVIVQDHALGDVDILALTDIGRSVR